MARGYDFHYPEDRLLALAKAIEALVDDKARYTDRSRRENIRTGS